MYAITGLLAPLSRSGCAGSAPRRGGEAPPIRVRAAPSIPAAWRLHRRAVRGGPGGGAGNSRHLSAGCRFQGSGFAVRSRPPASRAAPRCARPRRAAASCRGGSAGTAGTARGSLREREVPTSPRRSEVRGGWAGATRTEPCSCPRCRATDPCTHSNKRGAWVRGQQFPAPGMFSDVRVQSQLHVCSYFSRFLPQLVAGLSARVRRFWGGGLTQERSPARSACLLGRCLPRFGRFRLIPNDFPEGFSK